MSSQAISLRAKKNVQIMKNILVTGTYRSGTTLLQKMLDVHPNLEIAFQPALPLFKNIYRRHLNIQGEGSNEDVPLGLQYHDPLQTNEFTNVLNQIAFDHADIDELLRETADIYSSDLADGEKNFPTQEFLDILKATLTPGPTSKIVTDFFNAIATYRASKDAIYIGFKEVYIECFIPQLIECYGDNFKVIATLRDPRGILASRNYGSYASEARGYRHPLLFLTKMWRTSARYHHTFQKLYPGQILSLKFEDMVSDLNRTATLVSKHLDIEDCATMSDPSAYRCEDGDLWKKNTSHSSAKNQESTSKWKELVPDTAIGAVEFLCWSEMLMVGYVPGRELDQAEKDFKAFSEEISMTVPWTRTNEFLLDRDRKQLEIHRVRESSHDEEGVKV
jgi:hypothetical protein